MSVREAKALTCVPLVFTDVLLLLTLLISYVNSSNFLKFKLKLTYDTLESVRRLEKTLNLLGIEPWLSMRQAEALTDVSIVFTVVFYYLFLLISYVNS